jgi:hypothetical protein
VAFDVYRTFKVTSAGRGGQDGSWGASMCPGLALTVAVKYLIPTI